MGLTHLINSNPQLSTPNSHPYLNYQLKTHALTVKSHVEKKLYTKFVREVGKSVILWKYLLNIGLIN